MKTLTIHRAGWLIIGLTVLPLIQAAAGPQPLSSQEERLEWLLATHDVRYAIHASLATHSDARDCGEAGHRR